MEPRCGGGPTRALSTTVFRIPGMPNSTLTTVRAHNLASTPETRICHSLPHCASVCPAQAAWSFVRLLYVCLCLGEYVLCMRAFWFVACLGTHNAHYTHVCRVRIFRNKQSSSRYSSGGPGRGAPAQERKWRNCNARHQEKQAPDLLAT